MEGVPKRRGRPPKVKPEELPEKQSSNQPRSRMQPGEERGGERIVREPNLTDEPDKETRALMSQAQELGKIYKHDVQVWRTHSQSAEFRCNKCRKSGGAALYPMRGKDQINGDIFEGKCRA